MRLGLRLDENDSLTSWYFTGIHLGALQPNIGASALIDESANRKRSWP